jgi:hypothetical protein
MKKMGPVGGMLGNAMRAKTERKVRLDNAAGTRKSPTKPKAKPKSKLSPTKPTAKTPRGVQKTKAQGQKELNALRAKQRARTQNMKKTQTKRGR